MKRSALPPAADVIAQTAHLRFATRGGWSYVERTNAGGVVCVVALTQDNRIILVEQYRPPVACRVIELPAGLCGDLTDQADESLEAAAERELLEETGYRASQLRNVGTVASSAGLTNEVTSIFIADQVEKIAAGGGDDHEDISIHEVPLDEIDHWLDQMRDTGKLIDSRVLGGLYLLQREIERRRLDRATT